MVSTDKVIRRVAWTEVFPWLILFRTVPVAASISVWILALIGTVATPVGWIASETLFVRRTALESDLLFSEAVRMNRSPYLAVFDASEKRANNIEILGAHLSGPRAVFYRLTDPFRQLFRPDAGVSRFSYYLLGCVWTLAVWALIGCGITRIALLRLTRDESAGLDDAFEFALPRFSHCLGAVGLPLATVFLLVLPGMLIGLLMSFDAGLLVASLAWGLVLLCGLFMTLLLIGMFFAWPLVISSISAESQSPLDAVTRCLSYVYQRPFHLAFYLLLAVVVGGLSWILVSKIAFGTVGMAQWAGSWGANVANADRMDLVMGLEVAAERAEGAGVAGVQAAEPGVAKGGATPIAAGGAGQAEEGFAFRSGRSVVALWNSLVSTAAVAFLYGLFWCMASAIYLLLRRDVDEVEMDEVFIDERSRSFDIPPLQTDANGIPRIRPVDDDDRTSAAAGETRV